MEVGSIYGCIAGDHRYGQCISVSVPIDEKDDGWKVVHVTLSENGAVGGMDGPGGSHPFNAVHSETCKLDAREIVRTIKSVIASHGDTIRSYAKPTKQFRWSFGETVRTGLNVKNAQWAIEMIVVYKFNMCHDEC